MDKYGDSTFYKYSINRLHGYDVFYSKGKYESFIYNLNYKNAYLLIELIKNKKEIPIHFLQKATQSFTDLHLNLY